MKQNGHISSAIKTHDHSVRTVKKIMFLKM